MKIATWNVNSLRVRLPHVLKWLEIVEPDVLAIQETKLTDDNFPLAALESVGYHVTFSGQKTYNGVALISREKITDIIVDFPSYIDPQRRLLAASFGKLRVLNLYVPNGENIISTKYQYKLNWLQNLDSFVKQELIKYPEMVILGDFNIAPDEKDVYDAKRLEGKVLCSVPERQAFKNMLEIGFNDCYRLHAPDEKDFSWWDYRVGAFERNLGLRIDHILASKTLASRCMHCYIDKAPRSWERPSDHTPVVAEFSSF